MDAAGSTGPLGMSETYTPDNLLDRLSDPATLSEPVSYTHLTLPTICSV